MCKKSIRTIVSDLWIVFLLVTLMEVPWLLRHEAVTRNVWRLLLRLPLEYRLYGVIQDVVFTHQPHFSCSFLSLICLSTNQNIQLIHSLLIRIEWTTGNGILMSSSHWPIYNKFPPEAATRYELLISVENYIVSHQNADCDSKIPFLPRHSLFMLQCSKG